MICGSQVQYFRKQLLYDNIQQIKLMQTITKNILFAISRRRVL